MRYVIKHKSKNLYFRRIIGLMKHCVCDYHEAKIYKDKKNAKLDMLMITHSENYIIVPIK